MSVSDLAEEAARRYCEAVPFREWLAPLDAAVGRGVAGIAVAASGVMAKKSDRARAERLKTATATFFANRTPRGRFKEIAENNRSRAADRRS